MLGAKYLDQGHTHGRFSIQTISPQLYILNVILDSQETHK